MIRNKWEQFDKLTPRLLKWFKSLPVRTFESGRPDLCQVFRRMAAVSRRVLMEQADAELRTRIFAAAFTHADVAYPRTGSWPSPAPEHVVERVCLDESGIQSILSTVRGQRFVTMASGLSSFSEFEEERGLSVREFLGAAVRKKTRQFELAMELACPTCPCDYEVSFCEKDAVDVTRVLGFSEGGVRRFVMAKRPKRTILAMRAHPVVFVENRYERKPS